MATKQTFNTFSESDSPVDNYFNNKSRAVESSKKPQADYISPEMELIMKQKRSIVLKIATDCDIKESTDFKKFNAWMLKNSILKKQLNAYNYTELDDLIIQFRGIKRNYENSSEKVGTKAWHHTTGIPKPNNN